MPTPEVTPIPGLCISQSNLTTFINNLNLSFDLMVQTINEELGVSLTLPGIPPIPLAGMPSISIPKFEAMDINRRFMRQPGLRGYVGNVFPVSQGGKGLGGKYTLPGYPGFNVEGFQGQIPGIDPSTYIINLLNQNYQILVSQLAEEGVTVEVTTIPQLDLCGPDNTQGGQQPGGSGTSPGATTVVNIVNQNNQNILNGLPADCFASGFNPLTDSGYFSAIVGPISANVTATTVEGIWTSGANSQLLFTGYDTTAVNPYTGNAPAQLLATGTCSGHGARLDYSFEVNATGAGGGRMRVALVKVEEDGTLTFIDANDHTVSGGASLSGTDSLTLSPGGLTGNEAVALFVRINGDGPEPRQGDALFTYTDLVDLGV